MSKPREIDSPEALREQYRDPTNLNARSAIYRFGSNPTPWPRWVFDQLRDLPVGARILEIGRGAGALWRANLDRLPSGWRVTISDLSDGMLAAAKDLPVMRVQADAKALPFAGGLFDAVVANHMLYHVPERPMALREIRRVLRAGGRLIAGTNGAAHMKHISDLVRRYHPRAETLFGEMPFTLENGLQQLRDVFGQVELRRRKDTLRVTDANAVVAYVMSVADAVECITGDKLDQMSREIETEIASKGAFECQVDAGVLIATS